MRHNENTCAHNYNYFDRLEIIVLVHRKASKIADVGSTVRKRKNDENQRKKKLISLFVPYHKKPLPHLSSPSPLPTPQLGFRGKRLIDKLTLYTLTPVYISPHCSLHIPSDTDKDNFFDNRELLESMIVS